MPDLVQGADLPAPQSPSSQAPPAGEPGSRGNGNGTGPAAGTPAPSQELFTRHYQALHRLARQQLARGDGGAQPHQVMSAKSLVHEAWLSMADRAQQPFENTDHFIGYAARAMRGLIVDHARARYSQKRGGQFQLVTLDTVAADQAAEPGDVVRIHEHLLELESFAPELAELVELRFFGGLLPSEIAQLRGVSVRTVQRDWDKARGLLSALLRGAAATASN